LALIAESESEVVVERLQFSVAIGLRRSGLLTRQGLGLRKPAMRSARGAPAPLIFRFSFASEADADAFKKRRGAP
jgi:hypothetical protein